MAAAVTGYFAGAVAAAGPPEPGGVLVLIVLLALSAPTLAGLTFPGERLTVSIMT